MIGVRGRWSWGWNISHSHLGGVLVWKSPRREGVLPAGDTGELERDVVSGGRVAGTRHVFPEAEETGAKRVPRAEEARVGREEVP